MCFAAYIFIYLPWFMVLEKVIGSDYPGLHIMNIPLDDMIPFCEYFIIPYVIWYAYVVGACVYMYFKADNKEFVQFALSLIIGMSLALTICMIYPNGLTLRPDYIPDNFCGHIINGLYSIDTATNVFPSIHVYNSLVVNFALLHCKAMDGHNLIKLISSVLCVLICLATVFLKQHSVIDVIGAITLYIVLYIFIYVVDYSKLKEKKAQYSEN